ncbi:MULTISPECIES: hypothetical protein [Clostridium]|uniref:Uncharacterized protein n=2 Tax=Clostridium TaxID=1485 RepID=A0A1A6AMA3_9CLOT|nr:MULTISPECIES: hypothetical protein [Clostridium]AGY74506.1 hypothetical protein CAETHG_0275 [Clostridium autoethanogenum DSM 10061]ALU34693.1 Hypothetical protein CLAU_0264 [Clostridium autoethanogenum DSM 10061]OBR91197.1 hypothetical protein CLRAG_31390 [Clostridium ragsdalei P11]OVY51412.1 hypothetical protein WX72_01545 [Clostridium autoethanogenum]QXE17505.1 hypothetical protein B5S50_00815 [Clostridium sp. 001]
MKTFQTLIDETLQAKDLDELESAADLFQFGIEKGYYNQRQSNEFNTTYWKIKNKYLAYEIANQIKYSKLDILTIVINAPVNIKDNKSELLSYVNGRIKALRGKISGIK